MATPISDPTDQRRFSNALRLQSEQRIEALTRQLTNKEIDLAAWERNMKAELRRANHEQFLVGKGNDLAGIKRSDYLRLGPELKRQYKYLRRFAAVIEKADADGLNLNFAVARARMYAKSTQAMFWKSALPVDLPQVPRDGKTECRTNCKCRLRIQYERDDNNAVVAALVWWQLSPAEHCEDCKRLARTWNPLRVETGGAVKESSIEQSLALVLMETPNLPAAAARELYAMWDVKLEEALCQ